MVLEELNHHQNTIAKVIEQLVPIIETSCKMINETLLSGGKILLAGNGGSAADAQHIAAELTGRYVKERKALPAIALTVDTSALTAISNDYGYDSVFSRQIEALGNSANILRSLESAKAVGCKTIGLSGRDGGKMNELCDINIIVPDDVTARIQEMHILIGHIFCKSVDEQY